MNKYSAIGASNVIPGYENRITDTEIPFKRPDEATLRVPKSPLPEPIFRRRQIHVNVKEDVIYATMRQISAQSHIEFFLQSEAFARLMTFIYTVNDAIRSKKISDCKCEDERIGKLLHVLDVLILWVDEIPPDVQPQRYGNRAYKVWFDKMVENANKLLNEMLPTELRPFFPEFQTYFIHSFGNSTRIDYGSGHDLAGFFNHENYDAIFLLVFVRYLTLVRKLQLVYKLEPAGSHGVWGLDDYQHLSYLWGSSQFINHPMVKPKSVLNKEVVYTYHTQYVYLSCIDFVNTVKTGPFHEHSPMLFDITGVLKWSKVNSGLIKMYVGEVLSKVPVMQHFEFGQLLPWRPTDE